MMRIAMAQITTDPGCIDGNVKKIKDYILKAHAAGAEVVVFPELAIPGYPALDLYNDRAFQEACKVALEDIKKLTEKTTDLLVIVGNIYCHDFGDEGNPNEMEMFNSAVVLINGEEVDGVDKQLLPDYDIFFESRYFSSGEAWQQSSVHHNGKTICLVVCEDLWDDKYNSSPYDQIMRNESDVVISINASPFVTGKRKIRHDVVRRKIASNEEHKPECVVYVNAVGGQDGYEGEIIFDGGSFAMDGDGNVIAEAERFEEELCCFKPDFEPLEEEDESPLKEIEDIYDAIVLGIKDYFRRCGLTQAVIGLSGGIDSAVTVALAVEALGASNVCGITMPSEYSSEGSCRDSYHFVDSLGIRVIHAPIGGPVDCYRHEFMQDGMGSYVGNIQGTLTEENLQARIRGNILMAFANANPGTIVLSTGNKTELALGYCTAYGDMCGGLSPIADLDKMKVYELARYINRDREIIPNNTIEKPPSAELAPGQTDEAGLGAPYSVLAAVVNNIVEKGSHKAALLEEFSTTYEEVIDKCLCLIRINEWKRRQAPPSIKITDKAFGNGRRIPMSHKFSG